MPDAKAFTYAAIDSAGKQRRGVLTAGDEAEAFVLLRADGLSPLWIKSSSHKNVRGQLRDRESMEMLANLAELLEAGADIRTALSILTERAERAVAKSICLALSRDIGGGEPLDRAFGRHLGRHQALVSALVAAGEASGDLPGSLRRTAQMIEARLKLREQLVGVLAYPAFVLLSAVAAFLIILLFIIPTLAPLVADFGGDPPLAMKFMLRASEVLRTYGGAFVLALGLGGCAAITAARMRWLTTPFERLLLEGPISRTISSVVYGNFSVALGTMLSAGAPMSEALRLATRAVGLSLARSRLEIVGSQVRQGASLSAALSAVSGFPSAITRLASVGEASSTLGQMLVRGGGLEEAAALRRIQAAGQVAGPTLIVILGVLLGLFMAGLLSGISQMGQIGLT